MKFALLPLVVSRKFFSTRMPNGAKMTILEILNVLIFSLVDSQQKFPRDYRSIVGLDSLTQGWRTFLSGGSNLKSSTKKKNVGYGCKKKFITSADVQLSAQNQL